jgi:hypothetical protein
MVDIKEQYENDSKVEKNWINDKNMNNESNSNNDDDDDKSDSEITTSLEKIGVTIPSFMMPQFEIPTASTVSKKINDYFLQSVNMDHSSSSNLKIILGDLINKRTSDLKNLYAEVSESLTGIVNTNIDHPIEDYIDGNIDDLNDEVNKTQIKDQNIDNVTELKNNNIALKKYDYLTSLTFGQFQDQNFLRHRIKEILRLDIEPVLQRLLIQKLMSHSYIEKQNHIKAQLNHENLNGEEKKFKSGKKINSTGNNDELEEDDEEDDEEDIEEDEVVLSREDRTPTYYSIEDDILGCEHYQRNCKVECPKCHRWYTCRFCHDKANHSHKLERIKTKYILCMFCFTPQHPQQYCIECNKELSKYYCSKCTLYDNDPMKNIYHCDKCGICRLGLGLNQDYFHCDSCNACISIDLQKNHVCIENSTKSNCPICDEFMFSSNEKVVFMTCGHPIHEKCYRQHTLHSYKCPTCSKTITNMELQFRMRDTEIEHSKMPEEIKNWKAETKCVDCGGMSRVPFHYLGHKCDHCHSYNTMQLKLIKDNEESKTIDIDVNPDDELYVAEKFITDSLKQNFEFANVKERSVKTDEIVEDKVITEEDQSIDHDYVENFIRVINNFEAYSSIGDAFKDWINTSLEHDITDDAAADISKGKNTDLGI